MKRMLCFLIGVMLLLSGCTQPVVADTKAIQTVELLNLHLKESESFGVTDYYDNTLLLLVYDTQKRDPREEESLQAPARFCTKFVLYDLATQTVTKEYPIAQFGHTLSSIATFGGVLFTWITQDDSGNTESSVSYIDENGMRAVCDLAITKFSLGPLFARHADGVVFSYQNSLTDQVFGVKQIKPDLSVTSLLTFQPDAVDFISDDIVASEDHYIYAAGEQGQVRIYVGSKQEEPIQIKLSQEEKLYSFGITADWILVCKRAAMRDGGTYSLDRYDWHGNRVEQYALEMPLFYITGKQDNQLCGITAQAPVSVFSIIQGIQPVTLDTGMVDGSFHSVLTDGEKFILVSYGDQRPQLRTLPNGG